VNRVTEKGLVCINRERINEAGKVNVLCFDKTGTLTEVFLDIFGFRPVVYDKGSFLFDNFRESLDTKVKGLHSYFTECLSTCHSLSIVKGNLIGDPIDIEMFQSTGWVLNENRKKENEDLLVRLFFKN
jgi:cation-transporting ATPase 13A3/4/5